jgi:putative phosphoribosyl transferase
MVADIYIQSVHVKGELSIPDNSKGLVIFALDDGGAQIRGELSQIIKQHYDYGFTTLVFDLEGGPPDEVKDSLSVPERLTEKLIGVTKWCFEKPELKRQKIGFWGFGLGSVVALSTAAYWGTKIKAVVSVDGRPDLAMAELDLIEAPILLAVTGDTKEAVDSNRKAYIKIGSTKKMELLSKSKKMCDESGVWDRVFTLSAAWFDRFLFHDGMKE